jgi:hypothetical protein
MELDREQLRSIVLAGIKEVQEDSGRAWTDIVGASKVIGGVDGFESINGIEATCVVERLVIEQGLGAKVNAETLFTDGRRAHTVDEAVDILAKTIVGA